MQRVMFIFSLVIAGAPLTARAATFGAEGTIIPKGGLSLIHQRAVSPGQQSTGFTAVSVTPAIGYFVADNLAISGSLGWSGAFGPSAQFHALSGGLGVGYYLPIAGSFGFLPGVQADLSYSFTDFDDEFDDPFSPSLSLIVSGRLPLVVSHEGLFFGFGPEIRWYRQLSDVPFAGSSYQVGLFSELGVWF